MRRKVGYINVDPNAPTSRWYENTWWASAVIWSQRLSPLVGIAFAAMLAFGFQFKTPSSWFNDLNTKLEAQQAQYLALEQRVTNEEERARAANDTIVSKLDVLIRFRCLDLSERERATFAICD